MSLIGPRALQNNQLNVKNLELKFRGWGARCYIFNCRMFTTQKLKREGIWEPDDKILVFHSL